MQCVKHSSSDGLNDEITRNQRNDIPYIQQDEKVSDIIPQTSSILKMHGKLTIRRQTISFVLHFMAGILSKYIRIFAI